jgi:AsmA protein
MRALKLVGIVLVGLVSLTVVVLLAVRLFVDPNDYKARIARTVKDSTGRELTLAGPIKLAVFPRIALELGPASLGNPPGFGAEPFAAVQHVALRVRLLPLLRKELQIAHIEIDGLDLRLLKNAAGQGNWQDFAGKKPAPASSPSSASATERLPQLGDVEINDSRVSYQGTAADHLNIELGHRTSNNAIPVKLKTDLIPRRGAQPIALASQFELTLNTARKEYSITSLQLDGTMRNVTGTAPSWRFSTPALSLDLAAQTLSVPTFTTQLASANLTGSLRGSRMIDAPTLTGIFKLDPVALRDFMDKLGVAVPTTRDARALTTLAARGAFTYGDNALAATDLDIQLDDSRLSGKIAITNAQAVSFDIAIDRINLDQYRAPAEGVPQPAASSTGISDESGTDPFKTLEMNGALAIGSVRVSNLKLTDVHVGIASKDGVTQIAPATAKLYGGDYSGVITLDDRGTVTALKLDQSLTGVDMAPLLADFAKSRHVSGRGNVTINLTAQGLSGEALLKSLNGQIATNVDNGAVEGVDLGFEIDRAVALIDRQTAPSGQSSGRTTFETFKASANILNGVARTTDLNIASKNLLVTGQGTTNLVTGALDYQVKVTLAKSAPDSAAAATGKTLADIPLKITGTTANLEVRPDLGEIAKARLRQELDKHPGEIQQKLLDKLKGLFK